MSHRTMQGREVDMEKLMRQNELMPAVGNMRVNARGDELGPGGKIVKKREDVVAEYYEHNPNAVLKQPQVQVSIVEDRPTQVTSTAKIKKSQSDEE
jgi:hypothetical protein